MSSVNQNFEERLEEELAKIDPAALQYLDQLLAENVPAVRKVVQNVLDEPISQETEKRLQKPLRPKAYRPRPPPRQRKVRKMQELLREYDPFPAQNIRTVTDYQNEILDLFDDATHEGEESKGRRYIRWRFIRGLEKDLTTNFMEKIRENVDTAFYMRYVFSYQLRNIEDGTVILYYTNRGSPWINNLAEAEEWLSEEETKRLDLDKTERPSTKWEFVSFFNVDLKVVLDREPLLGIGPLPDWLRNLAHGGAMTALDTYKDNLCLWRCIAVHREARVDRRTKAARGLAKSFYKLKTIPANFAKTSLDELDKVETHLNQGTAVSSWFGIRVYEPERVEDGEVVWHLRRNVNPKLTNILTIGIYEGHAFLIKDITKLAKTYECTHCRGRFTQACSLKRHFQTCSAGKTVIDCPGGKVEAPQTAFEKAMYPNSTASRQALPWFERKAKKRGIHIHHARCGHGGEEMASARKGNNEELACRRVRPRNEDGVPIPLLPLPRMPKMFPALSRTKAYQ